MAQIPKRVKYRKSQRGNRGGNASRGVNVSFGDFGLQALDRGWMSSRQIEACRVAINRELNRKGKVWIRVFPHKPITSRPPETRMGKGKGPVEDWVAVINEAECAATTFAIDWPAYRTWQQIGTIWWPDAPFARNDEQAATLLDKADERLAGPSHRHARVVQDDDLPPRQVSRLEGLHGGRGHVERWARTNAKRAGQVEVGII